jgi:predicted kinase
VGQPEWAGWAEDKVTVVITRGLPASGKSTWAKQQVASAPAGHVIRLNNDDMAAMAFGPDAGFTKSTGRALAAMRETMLEGLLKSMSSGAIIIDNTNLVSSTVNRLATIAHKHGAEVILKDFLDVPVQTCMERNKQRENEVPADVIMRMAKQIGAARAYTLPQPQKIAQYHNDPSLPHTIIVDIDGTLADMGDRGPYDWGKVGQDTPNVPVVAVIQAMRARGAHIIVMSGRSSECYDATREWLDTHVGEGLPLHMREAGDHRSDAIIKHELFQEHVEDKYHVECVFDDRDQVVHLWRRQLGLKTFQVADGDF